MKLRNKILNLLSAAALSMAVVTTLFTNTATAPTLHATGTETLKTATFAYLDVGQGNAELIKTGKKTILIDTGKESEYDELEYQLKKLKVSKIDTLIISHPDADHMENADDVIKDYDVKQVIMPKVSATTQCYEHLKSTIKSEKVETIHPETGDTLNLAKNCKANVLSIDASSSDKNEASLVMRVTYGDTSFLYMGDVTAKVEGDILESGETVASDVYLMSHHGSDTANGILFQKKVLSANNKIAIISVGQDNSYGHPAKQVVDRAKRFADEVYRTDKKGAIVLKSDGSKLTESFIKVTHSSSSGSPQKSSSGNSNGNRHKNNNSNHNNQSTTTRNSATGTYVYVTETGTKYHKAGCRYLNRSKIRKRLSEARNAGYEPCSVCN